MASYTYGESPVHKLPTPLDNTPLDAVSWAKLVDAAASGKAFECASKSEQDAYIAAATANGLAPSSRRILRVCRTDLDRLVMSNDGTGWMRDSGGSWAKTASVNAAVTEGANTRASRGALSFDHPCRSLIRFEGDVTAVVPTNGAVWAFYIWIEDNTGREIPGTSRMYSNLPRAIETISAETRGVADMPAGPGQLILRTLVSGGSQSITFANVGVTASFA